MRQYETVIGLEVHIELATKTKIFCGCSTEFGGEPNTHTCPVCAGMPGSLPVLNRQVVEFALKAGIAANCQINQLCKFDRKNYFYPDNPQNYQISQLYLPLCHDGWIEIETSAGKKKIRIHEIHMEEDAGKLIHDEWEDCSLVDYNRSGVPLIEIVSEPDMRSAEEVIAYLDKLRCMMQYLGISDCKLQEGSMRADVNLSVCESGSDVWGTRTEMKNLNSFKAIAHAIEGERERPDPEEVDYDAYVYSILGYMKLSKLTDFIEHEYAHLVDESYVELTNANGFVRMAAYLSRQGGTPFSLDDTSDKALSLRADGEDASETFHKISEALLKEYPNFTYAAKGDWYVPESSTVTGVLQDILYIPSYAGHNAFIGIRTVLDEDKLNIEVSLNLPCVSDEEVMLDIHDKCNMLTLMTAAPFQVTLVPSESSDLSPSGDKIKAFVLYHYDDFKTMSEEDIVGLFSTSLEIFASYYTDICQNYYPAIEDDGNVEIGTETGDSSETGTDSVTDPLAAALGSKLTYRPAADVQGPQIIYKEGGTPASTDFITKAILG